MNYTVYAGQEEITLQTAAVFPPPYHCNRLMEYVQFTAAYPVYLTVRSETEVKSAVIRPLSLGLEPEVREGVIRIRLETPVKFSLEINGGIEDNLLVLAEEERYAGFLEAWGGQEGQGQEGQGQERVLELKKERRQQGKLVYFSRGVHDAGILTITESGTTVYLEEGAYVNGKMDLDHCDRVTICGYGVITMEQYPLEMRSTYQRCINAMYCRDLTIRDITITDSNDWSLRIFGCDNVLVDNVKIVGCRGNSDGIDVCGSRNVLVQNAFTRVWDDSLVVKALDTGNVENVTFRRCILWNDFARPMEVGVELRADEVKNVRFEDIDVLHSPTGYPLMGIHHGDRAVVSDIVFENIRIEDAPGAQLFDIRIAPSYWNRDHRMGCIRDVIFRDIHVAGRPGMPRLLSDSRLQGYDKEHDIQGVTFENIDILGKTVPDAESCGLLQMDHVGGVRFLAGEGGSLLELISTRIELAENFTLQEDGNYAGLVKVHFFNPFPREKEKEVWLEISPAHTGEYDRERKKVVLGADSGYCLSYPVILPPGKYVIALQSQDPEVRCAWHLTELDWVWGETDGQKQEGPGIPFVNYYGDRLGSVSASRRGGSLVLRSELLKRPDCQLVLYAAEPVKRRDGEVVFSVEETDFGVVPAVLSGRSGLELAPQLRCPLEITLVFKNEPKVEKITSMVIQGGCSEEVCISPEDLGLPGDTRHFWLEIEARLPEVEKYRYPYTLFHSVTPTTTAHMFGNCVI